MLTINIGAGTCDGEVVVNGMRLETDRMLESLCAQTEATKQVIVQVYRSESLS